MKALFISLAMLLGGCSLLPSRWDESQASSIVTFRQDVDTFNCTQPLGPQLDNLIKELNWLQIYSGYKGSKDLIVMVKILQGTVQEFAVRERFGGAPVSPTYCELKKTIIIDQTDIIGHTIKGSIQ